MKRELFISILLSAVFLALVFLKPFYEWPIRSFFSSGDGTSTATDLRVENEKLKAEIAKLNVPQLQTPANAHDYVRAMVYSQYPLNFKNELIVDVGKSRGIAPGKPVLFGGILVGKVSEVYDDSALVETVFDNNLQFSVGIGNAGMKALFIGGSFPKLILIPLVGDIQKGDIVYSLSPDFPYGTGVGEILDVSTSSDHFFREASLKFPYTINDMKAVFIGT